MALSKIYGILDPDNDVVKNIKSVISSGIWSGGGGTLTTFYTQSVQSASSGDYYVDVYKTNPQTDTTSEIQFSVTYGNIEGSGSLGTKGAATGNRATAAIHSQFVNLLLGPNVDKFKYAGSTDSGTISKHFYAISLRRARMREKIDPGNWELRLQSGSGTAASKTFSFIDNSDATTNPQSGIGGRIFDIVSGSISTGTTVKETAAASQAGGGYGLFYPDMGLLVFNADQIDSLVGLPSGSVNWGLTAPNLPNQTVTGSNILGGNAQKFYEIIESGSYFQARREERLSSTHYFCRVKNQEFNFSSNPTFFTGSDGLFSQPTFFKDPKTYITTVGLYNNSNELLAVAKLSQPVLKSYSREALIKVKLDF